MAATRRDQLLSYQFMIQRVVAAFTIRETDPVQSPFRKAAGAVFGSIMVTALILAGVAVFGFIRPGGNKSWKKSDVLIVEKETGALYLYLPDPRDRNKTKKLFPIINYASARLIMGQENPRQVSVSRHSLTAVKGSPVGIPGAPDSLPLRQNLLKANDAWTLCSRNDPSKTKADRPFWISVLYVGGQVGGGGDLGERALWVKDRDQQSGELRYHLVWNSYRHTVPKPQVVATALQRDVGQAIEVSPGWIEALPSGVELKPTELGSDRKKTSQGVPGVAVGQVLLDRGVGSETYYLVLMDGYAQISPFQAEVERIEHGTKVDERNPQTISGARRSAKTLLPPNQGDRANLPAARPELAAPSKVEQPICAEYRGESGVPERLMLDADVAKRDHLEQVDTGGVARGAALADKIVVEAPRGALVETVTAAGDTLPAGLFLITDSGKMYPIPQMENGAVAASLGYPPTRVKPIRLPSALVARIPVGPGLFPTDARRPALATDEELAEAP